MDNRVHGWIHNGILFQLIQKEEAVTIVNFLMKYYYPNEPFYLGCGVICDDLLKDRLIPFYENILVQGLSLKAMHPKSRELLGVRISAGHGINRVGDYLQDVESLPEDSRQNLQMTKKILCYEYVLEDTTEFQDRFPVNPNEIFYFLALATSAKSRNKGVGSNLVGQSLQVAKNMGFKCVKGSTTSEYSRKIYKKFGFDTLKETKFCDCQIDGEKIVTNDTGIHQLFAVHMMKL